MDPNLLNNLQKKNLTFIVILIVKGVGAEPSICILPCSQYKNLGLSSYHMPAVIDPNSYIRKS